MAGLPDAKYGEIVAAWVVPRTGASLTAEEVRNYCKGQITHFKIPEFVAITSAPPPNRHRQGAEARPQGANHRRAGPRRRRGDRDGVRALPVGPQRSLQCPKHAAQLGETEPPGELILSTARPGPRSPRITNCHLAIRPPKGLGESIPARSSRPIGWGRLILVRNGALVCREPPRYRVAGSCPDRRIVERSSSP